MCRSLFHYIESKKNPRVELSISTVEQTIDGPEMFKITMTSKDCFEHFEYTGRFTLYSNTHPSVFAYLNKDFTNNDLYILLDHMYYELERLVR